MRASDRDRDQIVGQLRAESLEGRVSQDDLERRLERALAAETIEELNAVVADLPALSQTVPQTTRSTAQLRLGRGGIRPFILQLVVAQPVGQVRAAALDTAAGGLVRSGFEMTRQTPATLEFLLTGREGWFPTTSERVVMSFERHGEADTVLLIYGRATRSVRKQLARLNST
jgi:Domain of unknown function (DUF1707)